MVTLSDEALARRLPVWDALSELFLDTETRWYLPRVAGVLAQSGYSPEELERIWRWEISPECAFNLLAVAGEWAAMPYSVEALARRAASRTFHLRDFIAAAPARRLLQPTWKALLALRALLVPLEPAERSQRVAVWGALLHAYLERSLDKLLFIDRELATLRQSGLTAEELERLFETELRPRVKGLLVGDERRDEERRAVNVRELISRAFLGGVAGAS